MEGGNGDIDVVPEEVLNFPVKVNYDAKLKELLHKITSIEIKLCSDAAKEFIRLLKGDDGGELLRQYVRASSKCSELVDAWKLRQGKPGMSYIFELIFSILSHHEGKYKPNDVESIDISRDLDKFAKLIAVEYLGDVYKELNSKEGKRQKAALLLMASIVRRGPTLASEIAKNFDFKLGEFMKLGEHKKGRNEKRIKQSLRKSFVGFAMSFLEVGKPGLLRWVLQQKEMYSGVLRGLGNDDDETVIYVLSTLRDRVLVEESLVPPALRSVLFGSVTLEHLVNISGREDGGHAAELAYNVLFMVCTDPDNGLMPDLKRDPVPLRGNPKRIMGLMKKLQATEIRDHKDFLLAIVNGRPSFGASYLEEFPYNTEDYMSPSWFNAISLAANVVSSVGNGLSMGFINAQLNEQYSFDNMAVQSIMKCLSARPFSRSTINKGLLHSDFIVKHGTLRLLLEALKLLNSLIGALNHYFCSSNQSMRHLVDLKQEVQDEVQTLLPDPQVLLTLLSSSGACFKTSHSSLKRTASRHEHSRKNVKKLRKDTDEGDIDIVVGGVSSAEHNTLNGNCGRVVSAIRADALDDEEDLMHVIAELWGLDPCSMPITTLKDSGIYLHCKLLDALRYYHRTVPYVLDGSFEFFMGLLNNPLELPVYLQVSLLSLLMEYIEWCPKSEIPLRTPPMLYKHLQVFIKLLIFSSENGVRDQAYRLAKAAMFSTGAFDKNLHEIVAWLLFLPGHHGMNSSVNALEVEVLQSLCPIVISFLCDAVSTVGNNLVKHWDTIKHYLHRLAGVEGVSPDFSPLTICVLEKCLRLVTSKSGAYSLPEKSMVLLYICSTLKYLLQTQVDAELLSALVNLVLTERLGDHCEYDEFFCEWNSMKHLLLFAKSIICQRGSCNFLGNEKSVSPDSSLSSALGEVKRLLSRAGGDEISGITIAFMSSIICVETDEILINLPLVLDISQKLIGIPFSFLSLVIFLDHSILSHASKLWPEMFYPGLNMAVSDLNAGSRNAFSVGISDLPLKAECVTCNQYFNATGADTTAFSLFLKQAPFHVIFPAMMCMNGHYSSKLCKIQELLLYKLSECRDVCSLLSNLRLILFWICQIQSYNKLNPSVDVDQLLDLCVTLVGNLLTQILVPLKVSEFTLNSGFLSSSQNILEVVKTIICHPTVLVSSTFPMGSSVNFANNNVGNSLDVLTIFSGKGVERFSNPVLKLFKTALEYLWSICTTHLCGSRARDVTDKELVKAFKGFQQSLFQEVTDRLDQCISTDNLMPVLTTLYVLHVLVRFFCPFQLLELVDWMFSRIEGDNLTDRKGALSVGCSLAAGAFSALAFYLKLEIRNRVIYDLFWEMGEKNTNVNIFEQIYSRVVNFALTLELEYADQCLLEAVNVLYKLKHMQQPAFHPLELAMCRIIMITPVEMISHCIYTINNKKAKFLYVLTEMSPLHLSIFGQLFLGILNRSLQHDGNAMGRSFNITLSEDHFILLLPACLSYLNSISVRLGMQMHKEFKHVPSFYSQILLKGFHQWKSFVSKDIFVEEYGEFIPSSLEHLLCLLNGSLLGKSIHMVQFHFALNRDSMNLKRRLKLFKSICPSPASYDELLDCDSQLIDCYSLHQSLNIINRVVAKLSLCKMLLSNGGADGDSKEVSSETGRKLEASRIRLITVLVDIWQFIIKKFSLASDQSGTITSTKILLLYNHLEVFMLTSTLELIVEMCDNLIQLQSIPFLEQLIRSALLYRFSDPTTLKILHLILIQLHEGKLPCDLYLQLLVAHSQFASTLHSVSQFSGTSPVGNFLKPLSGILKYLVIPSSDQYENGEKNGEAPEPFRGPLEIMKLLRVLFMIRAGQIGLNSGNDSGVNFKKLHSLLCLSYGGTLSQSDLEILKLIQEIESMGKSVSQNVADVDCFWGTAALRVKKEQSLGQYSSSNIKDDLEANEEWSISQQGENIAVDPDMCASTVLHYPFDRRTCDDLLSVHKIQPHDVWKMVKMYSSPLEVRKQYDPVFILRFSIYSLAKCHIEPLEFAGSGLLAIAFVSMSSPDNGIRRLAYDTLDIFKSALEKFPKRKDMMRLRLLLTSMQNMIENPWQRIPSVIALFAAEASCVLLDSSHDHYAAISALFIHSSKLNMRVIPLFHNYFWSNSSNAKAERLWILRLVYAGLNSDDDAMLYIKNSILENLMSYYVSPLSDFESKEIIIEVIKKSVKLHKTAQHLVKHCSLLSWFSSIILVFGERLNGDDGRFSLKQVLVVLKVVNELISSGNISKWLQKYALEQLMELSSNLFSFIFRDVTLTNLTVALVNPLLQMIAALLKLSQTRTTYQPHFTLSIEGIYQIYQVVHVCDQAATCINPVFALEAIILNAPPVSIFELNQEKLESFLLWSISIAIQSESSQKLMAKESHLYSTVGSGEEQEPRENSLVSKLLRWLTASVIVGKLYKKCDDIYLKSDKAPHIKSLQSLLEHVKNTSELRKQFKAGEEELLASTIVYLQLLLGDNCSLLPSVVSALCLLLCGASDSLGHKTDLLQGYDTLVSSLCLRVQCPPEANPSWRWSFCEPWKDVSLEKTDSQKLEEHHACLTLLVIFSNVLGQKMGSTCLSPLDIERSGVFEWERSFLKSG